MISKSSDSILSCTPSNLIQPGLNLTYIKCTNIWAHNTKIVANIESIFSRFVHAEIDKPESRTTHSPEANGKQMVKGDMSVWISLNKATCCVFYSISRKYKCTREVYLISKNLSLFCNTLTKIYLFFFVCYLHLNFL